MTEMDLQPPHDWRKFVVGIAVWFATIVVTAVMVMIVLDRTMDRGRDGVCQEDEACWNCETMGNRICGPGATTTTTWRVR